MLILTRTSGQSIMIGHDIVVKVLSNQDGRARIGIDAPDNVKILREEILPKSTQSSAPDIYKQSTAQY